MSSKCDIFNFKPLFLIGGGFTYIADLSPMLAFFLSLLQFTVDSHGS